MALIRQISGVFALCLLAAGLLSSVRADDFQFTGSTSTGSCPIGLKPSVVITGLPSGWYLYFSSTYSGSLQQSLQQYSLGANQYPFKTFSASWSGLSSSSGPVNSSSVGGSDLVITYCWAQTSFTAGSATKYTVNVPFTSSKGVVTYVASGANNSVTQWLTPTINFTYGQGGAEVVTPKVYGAGIIFIDNRLGYASTGMFGTEQVTLNPGYNAIPFYGELDSQGLPKARPASWLLGTSTGADGQKIWAGRVSPPVEGGTPVWSALNNLQILAGASGSGSTLKVTNAQNASLMDYVQLPAGMSKGSIVPLPGGMTAGSPGLPSGVTGGTSGALSSGTLSGGTAYLPSGYSAGTVAGNGGTGTATPTGTALTSTTSGASTEGEAGSYIAGASMAGMEEAGVAKGRAAAEKIAAESQAAADGIAAMRVSMLSENSGLGRAAGLWTTGGDGAISGSDSSWLNFTLPIAQWSVPIAIPPGWISLIRSILLWGTKIWFVTAILKLLMR